MAQYAADTYHGNFLASGTNATALARYGFAGVFPLFITKSEFPYSNCSIDRVDDVNLFTLTRVRWYGVGLGHQLVWPRRVGVAANSDGSLQIRATNKGEK